MHLEWPYPGGIQHFRPPCCPHPDCPTRSSPPAPFRYRLRGRYFRLCDRRIVRRFHCLVCRRSFSVQTFRVDYRLHRPELTGRIFDAFVSKTTQRQTARTLVCTRQTVRRRLLLLARHAHEFHTAVLERAARERRLPAAYQLDELETFERDRLLRPVTMPVLITRDHPFVICVRAAPLPSRGKLSPRNERRKRLMEAQEGRRRSGSRAAVKHCFEVLKSALGPGAHPKVETDGKASYKTVLKEVFGVGGFLHEVHSGKLPRRPGSVLWPVNHMLAMLRDGLSRLVRRTWGVSRERDWLGLHAWIWVAYRNYIRGRTNKRKHESAGQRAGVVSRRFSKASLFEWRVVPNA